MHKLHLLGAQLNPEWKGEKEQWIIVDYNLVLKFNTKNNGDKWIKDAQRLINVVTASRCGYLLLNIAAKGKNGMLRDFTISDRFSRIITLLKQLIK